METMIIKPQTISLLTTYQCTAACKNCCFNCNPNIRKRLTVNEMKTYIDMVKKAFPSDIKVVVLTGGEAFLLGNKLIEVVKYIAENNLISRIVTNGYWAKNYKIAFNKIEKLVNVGLNEINFSTGDDHQEFVNYDYIVNGCMASLDLGLTCIVNVETHDNSNFKAKQFVDDERLSEYFKPNGSRNKVLRVESGVWIPFSKDSNVTYNNLQMSEDSKGRCTTIFNTISINPYSEVLSCCGLTSEYIPTLRIGNLKTDDFQEIYLKQFNDFLKIWLYVEGPWSILKFIDEKKDININYNGHICDLCAEIFKSEENINILKMHYKEIVPSIILKYNLLYK